MGWRYDVLSYMFERGSGRKDRQVRGMQEVFKEDKTLLGKGGHT